MNERGAHMHAVFYPNKDKSDYALYIRKSISVKGKKSKVTVLKYPSINELNLTKKKALDFAKEKIKELEKEEKEISQSEIIEIKFNKEIMSSISDKKNTGMLFLQKVWSDLKLENFFNKLKYDQKLKIQYSLNDTARFLTYLRILNPASKLSTFSKRNDYIEDFSVTLQSLYDTLTILANNQKKITKYCNKQCSSLFANNTESIFYDCTNFYFEIEEADEDGFRSYGVEKNHRPVPIVEYGLLLSEDGFPLSSQVWDGHIGEKDSLLPLLKGCDEQTTSGKIIVGDAGLNTFKNKQNLITSGRHYIFVQSIKQLSDKNEFKQKQQKKGKTTERTQSIQEWALDRFNMKSYQVNGSTVYYKERRIIRTNGHEERLIVKFDEKIQKYLLAKIDRRVEKAKKIIKTPSTYSFSNCNDGKELIKKISFDTKSGEIDTKKSILELDEEKIQKEKDLAGFYAYVTDIYRPTAQDEPEKFKLKEMNEKKMQRSAIDILKIAGRRVDIEKCFRIMKTNLEGRPIYVQTRDHIAGHLFTVYLALLLISLLKKKYAQDKTTDSLFESLRNSSVACISPSIFKTLYWDANLSKLVKSMDLGELKYTYISNKNINKLISKSKNR